MVSDSESICSVLHCFVWQYSGSVVFCTAGHFIWLGSLQCVAMNTALLCLFLAPSKPPCQLSAAHSLTPMTPILSKAHPPNPCQPPAILLLPLATSSITPGLLQLHDLPTKSSPLHLSPSVLQGCRLVRNIRSFFHDLH
jgi:hypothetical protein